MRTNRGGRYINVDSFPSSSSLWLREKHPSTPAYKSLLLAKLL